VRQELHILDIEETPAATELVRSVFSRGQQVRFRVSWVGRAEDAGPVLEGDDLPDAILVELPAEATVAHPIFKWIAARSAAYPVLVTHAKERLDLAREALAHGAQDFLVTPALNSTAVARTVIYAIDRHDAATRRARAVALETRSLRDRGDLIALMSRDLRIAERLGESPTLFVYRLADFAKLGNSFDAGQTLRIQDHAASVFSWVFRTGDVTGRLNPTTFAALAHMATDADEGILEISVRKRLEERLCRLGTVTAVRFDPAKPATLRDLFTEATKRLDTDPLPTIDETTRRLASAIAGVSES